MESVVDNEEIMNSLIVEAVLTKTHSLGLNVEIVENAYRFAKEAVGDRLRESDRTSFLGHFIRVAAILALELGIIDSEVIAGGFLHALPSHTHVTHDMLEQKFGKRVSDSIKLLTINSEENQKHEALIKKLDESPEMMGAIVKLSDRLDNIRRLVFADRPGKRDHYIGQTEVLYVPFARRTNEYIYKGILRTLEKLRVK